VILLSFVTLSISFAYGLLPRWPAFGEIIGTRMKSVVVWVFFIPLILAVSLALILGWWRGTTEELAASETPPAHACVQLPWPMCNLDALALLGIFLVVLLAVSLAGRRLVLNDHDQGDLEELSTHLGLVPALIIGPMVLASDPLLIFPNVLGLAVVGFLVVNGLLVLLLVANMVVDADSQSIGRILAIVCIACLRSLAWLTGAAAAALIVAGNTLGVVPNQLLLAPAAFLLIILPYGHLFSRIWRYEFGYWWANEKVTMMELSILALVVVGPIPYGGLKVWLAVVAVIMLLLLPMTRALRIVMLVQRFSRSFGVQARRDWGIVLIKTNPGDVAGVMKEIDDLRHVHSVTAVLGGIDLMVSVEAFSAEEFTMSVGQVRSIAGVRKVEVAVDVTRLMPGREAPF